MDEIFGILFLGLCAGMFLLAIHIGQAHNYVDMMHGWKCTKGAADNCVQWTKQPNSPRKDG